MKKIKQKIYGKYERYEKYGDRFQEIGNIGNDYEKWGVLSPLLWRTIRRKHSYQP